MEKSKKLDVIMIELRIAGKSLILKDMPASEIWRRAEDRINSEPKPFRLQYVLIYRDMPIQCGIWSGERDIPKDFKIGDFARAIIHVCRTGGEIIKHKNPKGRAIVMTYYKAFIEKHHIHITN